MEDDAEESFPMTAAAVTVVPATPPTAEDGPESAVENPLAREGKARLQLRLNIEKEPLAPTQSSGPTLKIPSPRLTFDVEGQPPQSPQSPVAPLPRGATTAPVFVNERGRFFSFGGAGGTVGGVGNKAHLTNVRDSMRRYRYVRQNTVSGDPELREFPRVFTRAISHAAESAAGSSIHAEEWRQLFDILDESLDGRMDGIIRVEDFKKMLKEDPLWGEAVPRDVQEHIMRTVDRNSDGVIDFEEFLDLVRGRGMGFGRRKRRAFRELLKQTVEFIVPYEYSYQNQYSCSPPPIFMMVISLLQLVIFSYNSAMMYKEIDYVGLNGPVPFCSHLIYNPDKREQAWRYITYMFIHAGIYHFAFNILVQLVLGIPLEMVHGWWRVMLVYIFGVLAGSLTTSIFRPTVYLSGASGGVYALITAHLGTVIMNFREMTCPWCRILVVVVVAMTDVAVYVYDVVVIGNNSPVSYPAHIAGAVTGLLVGIVCLKNLRWERHERVIWIVSILLFAAMMLCAVVFNIAAGDHFTGAAIDPEFLAGEPGCKAKNIL